MAESNIEIELRLKEQLLELIEEYNIENVSRVFNQLSKESSQKLAPKETSGAMTQQVQSKVNYQGHTEAVEVAPPKSNLPPNVKSIEELQLSLGKFPPETQISEDILIYLKTFIENGKLIMDGQHKKVDESFIIDLTSKDLINATTPEEDWIKYNVDVIRRKLKRKLRLAGYDYIDTDVEVGKVYDPAKHNITEREIVTNPAEDNRIIRVLNEGIIIGGRLHINANVVVGQYTQN